MLFALQEWKGSWGDNQEGKEWKTEPTKGINSPLRLTVPLGKPAESTIAAQSGSK